MKISALARRRLRRSALPLILVLTYILSAAWAVATPVPNNEDSTGPAWGNFHPDEGSHTDVIKYMARRKTLPPYETRYYISVHPPLYHGLCAVAYAGSEMTLGYEGAMTGLRLITALCGVGIVLFTYQATRRIAPRSTALLAASLVALLPMRSALGGALSNENLAAFGAAGVLATTVEGITARAGFNGRQIALLAVYLCVGIGSKISCIGLLPVVGLALIWKTRSMRTPLAASILQFLLLIASVGVCWGWWFARNQLMYGDPLRNAAADRLWQIPPTAAYIEEHRTLLAYSLRIAWGSWRSFFGTFDGMRRVLPLFAYGIFAALQIVAAFGLWRRQQMKMLSRRSNPSFCLFFLFGAFVLAFFCLYNVRHYAPQGRYFFVLLLPFGLLTAIGWQAGLPGKLRRRATPALLLFLSLLNLYLLIVIPRRLSYFPLQPATQWQPPQVSDHSP